jgi:hypothetical protein
VLLVISLILVMAANADSLVLGGRSKQFIRDIEANRLAYLMYMERYRAVPGDDDQAEQRWPEAKNGNGDWRVSGTYRDSVASPLHLLVGADSGETINYWWHLRLAGLVNGGETITDLPKNLFGGSSGIQQTGYGMRGPVLCYQNVPAEIASAVDRQIDDGWANEGALRGSTAESNIPSKGYDISGEYIVCTSLSGSRVGDVKQLIKGRGNDNAHGANPNASPNASDGSGNGQGGSI